MSVINKLQFWKKDEPLDAPYDPVTQPLQDPLHQPDPLQHDAFSQSAFNQSSPDPFASSMNAPQGQYPMGSSFPGRQPAPAMQQPMSVPADQYADHAEPGIHPRDVELILAKLDAIKSELDALHQRVRKIEQVNDTSQSAQASQKKYW